MSLDPQVAVISGGGSGIGRAIALVLARRGTRLALLGRRAEELEETLGLAGGGGVAIPCDVRDSSAVRSAAARVAAELGRATILVPCAGVVTVAPLEEIAPEAFAEVLETNVAGVFHQLHSFLPQLRSAPAAWIFPVLSLAAQRGFAGWSAYCASKWGLRGLLAALREELRGSSVRLTAIYPGATATGLWERVPGSWDRAAMVPVSDIAGCVEWALGLSPEAALEEIHLGPAAGAL